MKRLVIETTLQQNESGALSPLLTFTPRDGESVVVLSDHIDGPTHVELRLLDDTNIGDATVIEPSSPV